MKPNGPSPLWWLHSVPKIKNTTVAWKIWQCEIKAINGRYTHTVGHLNLSQGTFESNVLMVVHQSFKWIHSTVMYVTVKESIMELHCLGSVRTYNISRVFWCSVDRRMLFRSRFATLSVDEHVVTCYSIPLLLVFSKPLRWNLLQLVLLQTCTRGCFYSALS